MLMLEVHIILGTILISLALHCLYYFFSIISFSKSKQANYPAIQLSTLVLLKRESMSGKGEHDVEESLLDLEPDNMEISKVICPCKQS